MSCNAKKDPNGTWRIQYRWTDWTGTKKKSQKRGFKTKKEAEEWYAHFMLQQSSDPTMTLADFWEIYKADMEKRLRKTTMKQKEYVMNDKVLPYFGKTPINEITAPMIRKWQGEMMEKGFKPTYLKTIHNQLIATEFKGAANDYVRGLMDVIADKGWDNIPDIQMDIMYSGKNGLYVA